MSPTLPAAGSAPIRKSPTLPFGLIVSPRLGYAHTDHRVVAETVWQRSRHLVTPYEIRTCDSELGRPSLSVDIDGEECQRKGDLLETHYTSQRGRTGSRVDTIRAAACLRAFEAATRYAEAFYCRKLTL